MDIEATVKQITGHCACHESYTSRRMVDPGCTFHELSADIADALRKAQDEAFERAAGVAGNGRFLHDDSLEARWGRACAKMIRSLKSKGGTK